MSDHGWGLSMLRFVAVLGIVGFLSGFIGPMFLTDGNQGPLTGIFITGPGGALLGLLLGALARARGWSGRTNAQVLWATAAVSCGAILIACIPRARPVADLVDGEIRVCGPVDALKSKTVAYWQSYEAERPQRTTTDWAARFNSLLAQTPGITITLRPTRERSVLREDAPWNRGRLKPARWEPATGERRYFVPGGDCARFTPGAASVFLVDGGVGYWPPHDAAELLGMRRAQLAPPAYASLAATP